jgi:hypothetical protein
MRAPVYRGEYSAANRLRIVMRLLIKGILPGGPRRWAAFLGTVPWSAPGQLPMVISDWITGLSMRSYVQRRFAREPAAQSTLDRRVRALRHAVARYLDAGKVRVAWGPGRLHLALSLNGKLEARFFSRMAPRLERLLRDTRSTVTLRIEELQAQQVAHLEQLLARLARHGDRVSIIMHEKLRALVSVDSSVFHLVLAGLPDAPAAE